MDLTHTGIWETSAGLAIVTAGAGTGIWLLLRRRPTPDEVERARRGFLIQHGRINDGMLLDLFHSESADGRTRSMLVFSYCVGGVDYQCSQDITTLNDLIDPALLRIGFPCSVRYQSGNPQNSIVVAEQWTGLRTLSSAPLSAEGGQILNHGE
ncbi:MAG TPA: hypothetical protein VFI20_08540 [Terracidiphilus sp.]|nr:hypothetical protein [Terracidiphilus sp.]